MVNVIDLPLSEYISKKEVKSDIDLPLSDIISKKRINLKKPKLEGIVKAKTVVARPAVNMKTVTRTVTTGTTDDARNHIIQKKRLQFVDARDQLAKIAKTGDARARLNLKRTDGAPKKTGGIPALMQEIESAKPVDMRQKLNQKRAGPVQVKKNFSITQQKTGLQIQRAAPVGQTRMQGTSLVRTVSTASRPSVKANNGLSGTVINDFHRSHPVQQQQQQVVAQPNTVVVRNTVPLVQQARPIQVARRRVVPSARNTVYTTARPRQQLVAQAPQVVYRQVPVRRGYSAASAPRPLMEAPVTTARARLEPRASSGYSSRSAMVATNEVYHQPQHNSVVYSEEPQVIYQDEEPLEYEYEDELLAAEPPMQEDELYYQERTPSPVYEQEYDQDLYIPEPAPRQQQHYGPPAPQQPRPVAYSQSGYVSRTPQQPRSQPQRMVAQPARIQQRPQPQQQRMQPQPVRMQQQPVRMQPQQQRMQPQQQRMQPQQQRMQPQQQRMQPQQQRMQPQQQRMQPQQQRMQPQQQRMQPQQTRPLQQQTIRRPGPSPRQQQAVPMTPTVKVVGHKVVVSNLHVVATLEDIEELFGNIGPISSCKMTRPGTAAVVFLNFSDAQKSVEVYHNRKLDGQPMQVKIVGSVSETTPVQQQQQRNISRMRY